MYGCLLGVDVPQIRFPTLLLLNKADQGGETDQNIARIVERYDASKCFVARLVGREGMSSPFLVDYYRPSHPNCQSIEQDRNSPGRAGKV